MKSVLLSIVMLVTIVLTSGNVSAQTLGTYEPKVVTENFTIGGVEITMKWFSATGIHYYGKDVLNKYVTIKNGVVYAKPCCDRPVSITVDTNNGQAVYNVQPGAKKIVLARTSEKARIELQF
jgi:hypothetical protein